MTEPATLAAPRLSVVVPSRDCLEFLPGAIASIRAQNVGPIEIVVVDNGSVDGTWAYLEEAARGDPWLKPLFHAPPGVAGARNAGVAHAAAEIVGFLDADDQYLPDAVDDRLALMERDPGIVLTFADVRSVTPDGDLVGYQFAYWPCFRAFLGGRQGLVPLGPDAFAMLAAEMVCGTSSVMVRRSAFHHVGGFDPRFQIGEDWDLWLRLAKAGAVWCSTRCSTRYLVRPGSTSRHLEDRVRQVREVFARNVPDPSCLPEPYRSAALARMHDATAELARLTGRRWTALRERVVILWHAPSMRHAREAAFDLARLLRLR